MTQYELLKTKKKRIKFDFINHVKCLSITLPIVGILDWCNHYGDSYLVVIMKFV